MNTVPTPHVVLEEGELSDGTMVVIGHRRYLAGEAFRAVYDPLHVTVERAEVMVRVELGRRLPYPVGLVISVGGSLHLTRLPEGEPLRVVEQDDGRTRFELDTEQVPLVEALKLLQEARYRKKETRATGDEVPECGARKPGWEHGPAIGRHRIPCTLPTGHQGVHRDGLGQTWGKVAK